MTGLELAQELYAKIGAKPGYAEACISLGYPIYGPGKWQESISETDLAKVRDTDRKFNTPYAIKTLNELMFPKRIN